jgi:ubiquitin carboxyl-terminal hydrolase 7
VPRHGNISDLLAGLQKKVNIDDETMQHVRVYETHTAKMYKELSVNYNIAGINESVNLYAEKIPEDENSIHDGDRIINAFNFDREPNKPHGVPFKFVVKSVSAHNAFLIPSHTHKLQGEIFKETKERLSKRTGIKGKQFEKIKFAIVSRLLYSNPRYLEDGECTFRFCSFNASDISPLDDILSDIVSDPEDLLGLDHVSKSRSFWNRGESFFIR